jgi:hypothetical protein
LTFAIAGSLPGFTLNAIAGAFKSVYAQISAVCDLRFADVTPHTSNANILITFGPIDGPQNTLAWSELPCGQVARVTQKFDTGEKFVIASNPPPNKISFGLVALHETLHALGVPHLSGGLAVMNPVYNPSVTTLQPLDIAELVTRYGVPATPTPTPEPPAPPGEFTELIAFLKDSQGRPVIRIGGVLFGVEALTR